ncbi:tRNA methyltransferase ppm2 [Microsporum canis]
MHDYQTNGSSIVSKRSVERIYYNEPHFFQHFVKSSPRRAPLINRGYWLRMYAIEHTVTEFLREKIGHPKLVINFGCGFDPLAFQFLSREPGLCVDTKFIDIDHRKMILEKWDVIQNSPELKELIPDAVFSGHGGPLIRAKQYIGIGCDLGNLSELEQTLKSELDPSKFSVLCTAEVALTYMAVKAADALIEWAGRLSNDTQFGLLEQFFPDGPEHPFAKTMIAHFTKWRAPLQSIHIYPTLAKQEKRFLDANWKQAHARSLWEAWNDPSFLNSGIRISLDQFEVFDEWEEFALFASHYFLLRASTRIPTSKDIDKAANNIDPEPMDSEMRLTANHQSDFIGQRRHGALFSFGGQVGFHAGLGRQARLASTDIYVPCNNATSAIACVPPGSLTARVCHTITQLSNDQCLLVGGRTSPSRPLSDTWLMEGGRWQQSSSLPTPCFQHSATAVMLPSGEECVLIYGGKLSNSKVTAQFLLWRKTGERETWSTLTANGGSCLPRFGAVMSSIGKGTGVLIGGMSQDGLVLDEFWTWQISTSDTREISIRLTNETTRVQISHPQISKWVARFGATAHQLENKLVVIGGIAVSGCIPHEYEVIILDLSVLKYDSTDNNISPIPMAVGTSPAHSRPLLVGHSSIPITSGGVLIVGGGAVCFAFGTYWNNGTWLLNHGGLSGNNNEWRIVQPLPATPTPTTMNFAQHSMIGPLHQKLKRT